ncbi:hypothetical protein [Nitrospina watsonii]|uniref:hypothetical protein n=1 Tax=Nitrospina watsonii TaxID=1323948 RepID=UPI00249266D1|nr:hypothetical protein [Nitrospina watsonii]
MFLKITCSEECLFQLVGDSKVGHAFPGKEARRIRDPVKKQKRSQNAVSDHGRKPASPDKGAKLILLEGIPQQKQTKKCRFLKKTGRPWISSNYLYLK